VNPKFMKKLKKGAANSPDGDWVAFALGVQKRTYFGPRRAYRSYPAQCSRYMLGLVCELGFGSWSSLAPIFQGEFGVSG
jgi:hypothetical protein